jgi:hypothetical protein
MSSELAKHIKSDSKEIYHANSIFYHRGDRVIECKLPECELDKLEVFSLPKGHPAYTWDKTGKGVRARVDLDSDIVIGFYAGILRPGIFGEDNPYVFGVHPEELDLVIDAAITGNITRYINDPRETGSTSNIEAEDVTIQSCSNTIRCVQFRTTRIIKEGEELLYEYESSVKGYWTAYTPKFEVIDLTVIPDNAIAVKREKSMEPVTKKHCSRKYKLVVTAHKRMKDLDGLPRLKHIKLSNRWNVVLIVPLEFCSANDIGSDKPVAFLTKFSIETKTFIPVTMDETALKMTPQTDGKIHFSISATETNRVHPFPYTSLADGEVFRFCVRYDGLEIYSDCIYLIGNRWSDYDVSRWASGRFDRLAETVRIIEEVFPDY